MRFPELRSVMKSVVMKKLLGFLLSSLLLMVSACSDASDEKKKVGHFMLEQQRSELGELVTAWADRSEVPSVLLRVQRGGDTVFDGASGFWSFADDDDRPVSANAYFRSASVGKLFTAVTVLKLAEKGKLSLDAPLGYYLDDKLIYPLFGDYSDMVTIGQLLSHTSGLANIDNDPAKNSWMMQNSEKKKQPQELLSFAAELGLQYEPGKGQEYTSAGYILLGLVIEAVTEQAYHRVVREQVLAPLSLENTFEQAQEWPTEVELIHSYAGDYDMNQIHPSMEFADGGFVTTTADLTRFGIALAEGSFFERPQTYTTMMTTQGSEGIGFGPFIDENSSGELIFYHPGHWGVMLYVDPAQQLAIAFSVNQSEVDYAAFLEQVLKIVNAE